jgi:response regulator of citrate/malate metabolism
MEKAETLKKAHDDATAQLAATQKLVDEELEDLKQRQQVSQDALDKMIDERKELALANREEVLLKELHALTFLIVIELVQQKDVRANLLNDFSDALDLASTGGFRLRKIAQKMTSGPPIQRGIEGRHPNVLAASGA